LLHPRLRGARLRERAAVPRQPRLLPHPDPQRGLRLRLDDDGHARRRVPVSAADAHARLVAELREHALVIGEVVLTSGATAQYYVDAKRAILRPAGFAALAELVAARAREWGATAVGGMTMGADPVACAALAGGADVKAFFV